MIKTTRLRYLAADTPDEIVAALDQLQFKVEIKGAPIKDGKGWILYFVIPEMEGLEWDSVDLRGA